MANIVSQKRMASEILKCGTTRIRIEQVKEVEEALTREDVRQLIRKGFIKKVQKKGSSRKAARKIIAQKKKGRRKGMGSRKGRMKARNPKKRRWVESVKTLRRTIKELRDSGRIEKGDYRRLYLMVKGGMFRNRKHIMLYVKERELLKDAAKPVKKAKPRKAEKPKTKKWQKEQKKEQKNK